MAGINKRHVSKGKGERNDALKAQAIYTFGLTEIHHPILIEFGLGAETLSAGRADLNRLNELQAAREIVHDDGSAAFQKETGAKSMTSRFFRSLRLAAKLGLSPDVPEEKAILDAILTGEIKGTTRHMMDLMDTIKPRVTAVDEKLKPYFKGESPLARLEQLRAALEQADATQELKRTEAPTKTLELYEVKGRLLETIERINRVARLAFDGRADIIARFNKDILLRARQTAAEQPTENPTPAKSPVSSNTVTPATS